MARRDSFQLIKEYCKLKDYARDFQIVFREVEGYYARDSSANSIDPSILIQFLEQKLTNKKHLEQFSLLINEAAAMEVSTINMDELILKAKMNEVGFKLASALTNREDGVMPLMEEYTHLHNLTTLEEIDNNYAEVLTSENFEEIFTKRASHEGTLRFYPLVIDSRIETRLAPEHHVVTFGRPNMGKSAFNITVACGFARQGARGIYFINEDAASDIYARLVYNLSGMNVYEVEADFHRAREIAMLRGLGNIILIKLSPGTLKEIESYVDKLKPAWIVVDQLRNLTMKADSKTLQLEYATSGIRNVASKYKIIAVSTTQAGDSAEGKSIIVPGDVDYSNTGVVAQCDLMIGIGASEQQLRENIRVLNICKNKMTGWHGPVVSRLDPALSRYLSVNGGTV